MNKLITFPMAILFVLSFVGLLFTLSGWYAVPGPNGIVNFNGTIQSGWAGTTWDLSNAGLIIAAAFGLGLLVAFLGITVLGTSALSDTGQVMLFKTLGYFGLWAALSSGSGWAFSAIPVWGNVAYVMVTTMFALGFIMDLRTGVG
jgi:hypothetical protein